METKRLVCVESPETRFVTLVAIVRSYSCVIRTFSIRRGRPC